MPDQEKPQTIEMSAEEHREWIRSMLENTGKNAVEATAERIRLARTEAGLTQSQLAQRLQRRQAYISDLENAKAEPSISTLAQLAMALSVSLSSLLPSEWPQPDREPPKVDELTEREAALIERLRKLHGFSFHIAIRILNTLIDVDEENEEVMKRLDTFDF